MARARNGTAVTFDMLRAFVMLARTLKISETAERLQITRQTVRRHISDLECLRGGALFDLKKQAYELTPLGEASLMGALSILRQAESYADGAIRNSSRSHHLEAARHEGADGDKFLSQQHPVSAVALSGTKLVQETLRAWGSGMASIEAKEMAAVRPFLAVYRRSPAGWVCVEIGDQSAYARWFGWTWAKSAVGLLSENDHAGSAYNRFIAQAYDRIHGEGGVRFDHLFAHLPRENSAHPVPIMFQRLLMGCVFPDGTPALAVLTCATPNVEIDGLSDADRASVSTVLMQELGG